MDARITKSRLANLLSYDWLKILLAIIFAAGALLVFFTTVGTRPARYQEFEIYGHPGVVRGEGLTELATTLEGGDVFSYEILSVNATSFEDERYGYAALNARRAAGQGNVLFIADYAPEGEDPLEYENGLRRTIKGYVIRDPEGWHLEMVLEVEDYFKGAVAYVKQFFGEDWENGTLDEARAEQCFYNRNGKDKRFKTEAQKKEGVALEKERLLSLRDDLKVVLSAFEPDETGEPLLSVTTVTVTDDAGELIGEYGVGIKVGRLSRISSLYYYVLEDKTRSAEQLNMLLYNNGDRRGDLEYETVSFLRYLIEAYK